MKKQMKENLPEEIDLKSKILCLLTLLFFFITGCSASGFKSSEKQLEMTGNPTTGYTWNFTVGNDTVIQVDEQITYLGKDEIVGAPSLFVYTIRSLKSGSTTLKFEYKRPWEQAAPEDIKYYEVTVKDSGRIEMKEIKVEPDTNTYKSVFMSEGLKLMSDDTGYVLLDVRRPDEFDSGHIPGAVQLTSETFTQDDAERIISDKSQRVYVYCRSGRRSKQASQKLADFGYTNVIEIGGILDYSGKIEK